MSATTRAAPMGTDPSGEPAASSLAAEDSTAADPRLELDYQHLTLIRQDKALGATWALIGRAEGGKPPKIAKRDHKRLTARTRRAWYLQHNREG